MLEDALACFEAQIEAVKVGVARLQAVDHPQALQVVLKAAVFGHAIVQCVLTRVAKRGVAQVVRQRNRLHQVLVQPQSPRQGSRQLRHLQ